MTMTSTRVAPLPLDERRHSVCLRCYPIHRESWDSMPDRMVAVCGVVFSRDLAPRTEPGEAPANPCEDCRRAQNRTRCGLCHALPGRNW